MAAAKQEVILLRAQWSSRALVVGQYIVGGVLATTLAQGFDANVVRFLGHLVLVSSLLREHFDPAMEAAAVSRQ